MDFSNSYSKKISIQSKNLLKEILLDEKITNLMNKLYEHHPATYQHSIRVALLSLELAIKNNIVNKDDLMTIGKAALLHDIGKMKTPIEILTKKSFLNTEEKEIMDKHPRDGFELLIKFPDDIRKIVVSHHEFNFENSYPRKIKYCSLGFQKRSFDEKIDAFSAMVAICDVYDALMTKREYKNITSIEEIETIMLKSSFLWNQEYVKQLI